MRIELVYPGLNRDPHPVYPLGVSYIAAVLRREGFDVGIIDQTFHKSMRDLRHRIRQEKPDVLGVSAITPLMDNAQKVVEITKRLFPDCLVVMGGPHPTILPTQTLDSPNVDLIVAGEGETTMLELVKTLEEGNKLSSVKGIYYKENGKNRFTGARPPIQDLNNLPFPAVDLLPLDKYHNVSAFWPIPHPAMVVMSSRGCPFNCSFCQPTLRTLFGAKVRRRTPENVVDEIEYYIKQYNARGFFFEDDTFTLNSTWVHKFCKEIKERRLDILWRCNSRVDSLNLALLESMKRAGCGLVSFGVESGSQEILNYLKKGISISQIRNIFEICRKVGVPSRAFFMVGTPGENKKTVEETMTLINQTKPDFIDVNITTPFPGTYLYKDALQRGIVRMKGWSRFHRKHAGILSLDSFTNSDLTRIRVDILNQFDRLRKDYLKPTMLLTERRYFLEYELRRLRLMLKVNPILALRTLASGHSIMRERQNMD